MSETYQIDYPRLTMYQMVENCANINPKDNALEFYGRLITYGELIRRIERCAKAFKALGIRKGDAVTLCMPNTPQTVECFYALNRIGAIANMIHPQSAQNEITYYLNLSESKAIVTIDLFCENVQNAIDNADHPVKAIICRMQDELPFFLSVAYFVKKGKDYMKYPNTDYGMLYQDFLKGADRIESVENEPRIEVREIVKIQTVKEAPAPEPWFKKVALPATTLILGLVVGRYSSNVFSYITKSA